MGKGETRDPVAEEEVRATLKKASDAKRSALASALSPPTPPPPPPRPPQSTTSPDTASWSPSLVSPNPNACGNNGASMPVPSEADFQGSNVAVSNSLPPPPLTGTSVDGVEETQISTSHRPSPAAFEDFHQCLSAEPPPGTVGGNVSHCSNQNVERSPTTMSEQLPLSTQLPQPSNIIVEDDPAAIIAPTESDANTNIVATERATIDPLGNGQQADEIPVLTGGEKTAILAASGGPTESAVLANTPTSGNGGNGTENGEVGAFSCGVVLEEGYELEKVSAVMGSLSVW